MLRDGEAQAGGEHTLLFNKRDGSIFSAGACGLGWCRLHPLNETLFRFRQVENGHNEPFRLVCASYYHNLAVGAKTGNLYSWGCGTFTDQNSMDGVIPALGQSMQNASDRGESPRTVLLPKAYQDKVVALSGGAYHSIVLQKSGQVLTFGAGQLGQLGRTLKASSSDASGLPVDHAPSPVEGLPPKHVDPVTKIGSGFYNTFALCKSGALFCSGENQNQQCGAIQDGTTNLSKMTRIRELDRVKGSIEQFEGGYCHTLIKTLSGKVFSMGCGDDGQRGDGMASLDNDDDDDVEEQRTKESQVAKVRQVVSEIILPDREVARKIAAGANHSVILSTTGKVYAFGANDVGQCGIENSEDGNDDDDESDNILRPTLVAIPGTASNVSAGYAHTVVTTTDGKVYAFGQNDNGQLGLGKSDVDIQLSPAQVDLPQQ